MLTALLVALLGLALFVWAMLAGPGRGDLFVNQVHHEYLGCLVAAAALWYGWVWLAWGAAVLCLDDGMQHFQERFGHSPVHMAYVWAATRLDRKSVV